MLITYLEITMAEMKEEHFEVVSSNRAKEYQKTKKTINIIRTLLSRYSRRQLIEMIEKESKNGR
jgi:hypothetical protein